MSLLEKNQHQTDIQQNGQGSVASATEVHQHYYNGITLEQYEAGLKRREAEVREELQGAHTKERDQLLLEKCVIEQKLADISASYEQHIEELKERIEQLELMRNVFPSKQFSQAKAALETGNDGLAEQLFAEISSQQESGILAAAEAEYQRGKIADDNVQYQRAYEKFLRANQLNPKSEKYLCALGALAQRLGDFREGLRYFQQTFALVKEKYGEESEHFAVVLNNIGYTYGAFDNAEKALTYYKQALEIERKVYGEVHPSVASTLNNIGTEYIRLGDYMSAVDNFLKAIEIDRKVHGENSSEVSCGLNNLASAYSNMGLLKTALRKYRKALTVELKLHDENHPDVATCFSNIGCTYSELGDAELALVFLNQALSIKHSIFGKEHPDVAIAYNNISLVFSELGDAEKALEYAQKALVIYRNTFGEDHQDTKCMLENYELLKQGFSSS